ncbi:hypothetical protein ANCCAN_06525 [Ancylostoma caninum]|uniref:DUF5641 domain-containing protein n=1 Tax=Ancylostoma caninum TaxID=29170 RepID=A0A368GSP2_ANCCA|nr:hypothetical protein ANCCAN_06525 [Ancylostoma caninum]
MGPLLKERVTESPPFTYTGMDLMGPIMIKGVQHDEDTKRYVVLFTCLVTRLTTHNAGRSGFAVRDFVYKDVRHGTTQLAPRIDEDDPKYLPYPELSSQKAAKEALTETERLTKKFWTMWRHEYLIELRNRHQMFGSKHKGTNREPRIDDVVILDEDNFASRGQWPLAVIIDIIRSRDGSTRSVILRTSAGREIQRPLNRTIPLEIQAVGNASNNDVASPKSGG